MKRFLLSAVLLLLVSAAALGAEDKIVLKIATVAPSRSAWDIELKKVAEEWNRITNGLVTVKIYNMSTLGGEKAGIQKLKAARPGQQAPLDGAIFTTIGLHELVPDAYACTALFNPKSRRTRSSAQRTRKKNRNKNQKRWV